MIMFLKLSRIRAYYRHYRYIPEIRIWDSPAGMAAAVIYISNMFFMTRAYAVSNVLETLLFGLFIFSPILRGQLLKVLKDPAIVPLNLFFLWALISGFWGYGSFLEIVDDWWGWRKLLLLPIGMVVLSDARVLKVAFAVALSVALLFLSLAYLAWILEIHSIWGRHYTSVLQNHNAQGIYFSLAAIGLIASNAISESKGVAFFLKVLLAGALIAFTIFLGSSRSGYVSAALAIFFIVMMIVRHKFLAILMSGFLVVALVLSSSMATYRIEQAISGVVVGSAEMGGDASSGSVRVVLWKNTVEIIKDHWLFGTGAAGFDEAYEEKVSGEAGWRGLSSDNPHGHYLHVWAEYGLIGLGLFLWFFLAIFLRADLRSPWGVALIATLCVACVIGLFDGVIGSAINGRIFIITFAIFLVAMDKNRIAGRLR